MTMHPLLLLLLVCCVDAALRVLEETPHSAEDDSEVLEQQREPSGRAALLARATETTADSELSALLRTLVQRVNEDLNCLALVGDRAHQAVFGRTFFKRLGLVPVFKVMVQDKEDLLSPNYRTLRAIRQVRKEGCRAYFLLFANGIQLARLLRFGDSQRVLDTRGRFVVLYDRRLLSPDLHYLWKKIVNVVFVRRFGGPWAVGSVAGRRSSWFELSTVPFPAPIRGVLVTRRLDIWRKGAFRQNADLFRDKTSDLQNQTLAVVTFQHVPAAYKLSTSTGHAADADVGGAGGGGEHDFSAAGFSGLEVQVMHALARAMNFAPRLYEPAHADREQWGRRQLDGSMSGLLGEVTSGRAELVLGDLHYTPYHLQLLDLSVPYHSECLTFLTPEAATDNSWQTLILPFKPEMWLAVGLALAGGGVFFFILAQSGVMQQREEARQQREEARRQRQAAEEHRHRHRHRLKATFRHAAARLGRGLGAVGAGVRRLSSQLPQLPQMAQMARLLRLRRHRQPWQEKEEEQREGSGGSPPGPDEPQKRALHLFAESLGSSMLYTTGMLLGVSLPRIPTAWAVRVMTGWWWLYSILVVVAYRAALTAILANPAPKITIDTLEQLADSALAVGGWGEHQKDFFLTSLDEAGQKVGRKFEVTDDWEAGVERVAQGSFAFYENAHFLQFAAARRRMKVKMQSDTDNNRTAAPDSMDAANGGGGASGNSSTGSTSGVVGTGIGSSGGGGSGDRGSTVSMAGNSSIAGNSSTTSSSSSSSSNGTNSTDASDQSGVLEARNLHIMRDCVINMPISLGLQRNSPLKPRVDRFLRRVIEAGLVHKWLTDAMLATTSSEVGSRKGEESVKALMELRKLYGALVALGAGYLLAALALLAEVAFYRGVLMRRVGFDVYAEGRGLAEHPEHPEHPEHAEQRGPGHDPRPALHYATPLAAA